MMDRVSTRQRIIAITLSTLIGVVTFAGLSGPALATPITVSNVLNFLDVRAANSVGFAPGARITFGANAVPNGAAGTNGSAVTTNLLTGLPVTQTLVFSGATAFPNQFIRNIVDDQNLRGPWTLTFQNGADTRTVITPSLVGVTAPPFATTVTISGDSQNPTFTWRYPIGTVDRVIINLFDKSRQTLTGGFDLVFSTSLPGTTNRFTVPDQLAGGLTLELGTNYTLRILGTEDRPDGGIEAVSSAFFDFTPLPAGSPLVNLPTVDEQGTYQYNLRVLLGQTIFVDPAIAIGYDFEIGSGDPNFASVLLPPDIGNGLYDVFEFDLNQNPVLVGDDVAGGVPFNFGLGGTSRFRILGIEESAGLDPGNTTAFITGLTFVSDGDFTGTQTPIVSDVSSVPGPRGSWLVVIGFFALLCSSRLFRESAGPANATPAGSRAAHGSAAPITTHGASPAIG